MSRYYFLTTFLPQLSLGQVPDLGSNEFDFLLRLNLTADDLKNVETIRRLTDLENIRLKLHGESATCGGNFSMGELTDMLLHQEKLPSYVFEFFNTYTSRHDQLAHFDTLMHTFFTQEIAKNKGFARDYLLLEKTWRLIFTALRAQALGRDVKTEFQDENPDDPLIQALVEQKNSTDIPEPYDELKLLFEQHKDKPLDLYQALAEWRFKKVEEMAGWHIFYVDRILAYIIQLDICEKWLELNKAKGLQIIETTVKEVS